MAHAPLLRIRFLSNLGGSRLNHAAALLAAFSLAAVCCARSHVVAQSNDWTYVEHEEGRRSRFELAFRGQAVSVRGALVTPVGGFFPAAPTDAGSSYGWVGDIGFKVISLPMTSSTLTADELAAGFAAAESPMRPGNLPGDWVYLSHVQIPGWAAPRKLFERQFLDSHPYQWSGPLPWIKSHSAKAILYEYIWFNGHRVAQIDHGTVIHLPFTDHLGTPLIQTTDSQAVWGARSTNLMAGCWVFCAAGSSAGGRPAAACT